MEPINPKIEGMIDILSQLDQSEKVKALKLLQDFIATNPNSAKTPPRTNEKTVCGAPQAQLFSCSKCGKKFHSKRELYAHVKEYAEISKSCRLCKRTFYSDLAFAFHKEEGFCVEAKNDGNAQSRKYFCAPCVQAFTNRKVFQNHIVTNHATTTENQRYSCGQCARNFTQRKSIYHHFKKHHNAKLGAQVESGEIDLEEGGSTELEYDGDEVEEELHCAHCAQTFRKKSALASHLKYHFPKEIYGCNLCKKSFVRYANYRLHLTTKLHRMNAGIETIYSRCEICQKILAGDQVLADHMRRTHKIDKLFDCPLCSDKRSFSSLGTLRRHMALHTKQRKYQCESCGSCYHTASALKDHKTYAHSETRNFSCHVCGSQFKLKTGLNRHFLTHANERAETCFCGQSYKLRTNLRKHQMMAHGYTDDTKKIKRLIKEDAGYAANSPKMVKKEINPSKNANSASENEFDMSVKNKKKKKVINCDAAKDLDDFVLQPFNIPDIDLACSNADFQEAYSQLEKFNATTKTDLTCLLSPMSLHPSRPAIAHYNEPYANFNGNLGYLNGVPINAMTTAPKLSDSINVNPGNNAYTMQQNSLSY